MQTLPATYLEVRATFILRGYTFAYVARQVGTSTQFVRQTLMLYWARADMQPSGEISKKILAFVEELLSHDKGCPAALDHTATCQCLACGDTCTC
jgi:hypothetical protein